MEKLIELKPKKDSRKSFYGKAFVKDIGEDGAYQLYSYNTLVCTVVFRQKYYLHYEVEYDKLFSQTTLRHIKEFLYQYAGLDIKSKEELLENECSYQELLELDNATEEEVALRQSEFYCY